MFVSISYCLVLGHICLALIFEYVPLDLHKYLKNVSRRLDIVEVKLITWQLFRGQSHLQKMEICHRDIKPQNLLYNSDTGLLKISDFGSSSFQTPKAPQPSYHVTRYYRPPELLLGSKYYGCELGEHIAKQFWKSFLFSDIWSCGCVFAELLKGGVFFAGRNTNNQLELIFDVLGKPTDEDLMAMKVSSTPKYTTVLQVICFSRDPKAIHFSELRTGCIEEDGRLLLPDQPDAESSERAQDGGVQHGDLTQGNVRVGGHPPAGAAVQPAEETVRDRLPPAALLPRGILLFRDD